MVNSKCIIDLNLKHKIIIFIKHKVEEGHMTFAMIITF